MLRPGRLQKGEVKRLLKARYGIGTQQCEEVVARARRLARRKANVSLERGRADALSFWRWVLRSSASTLREKMYAVEMTQKLLGLCAPIRVEATADAGAADLRREQHALALRDPVARDLMAQLAERLAGLDAGQPPTAGGAAVGRPVLAGPGAAGGRGCAGRRAAAG